MRWTGYIIFAVDSKQTNQSAPVCGVSQYSMAYLNERVDNSNVRTDVEHFVEVGLPVDELQLVELLIVLQEKNQQSGQANPAIVWDPLSDIFYSDNHQPPIQSVECINCAPQSPR